jgi:hypothetical protein
MMGPATSADPSTLIAAGLTNVTTEASGKAKATRHSLERDSKVCITIIESICISHDSRVKQKTFFSLAGKANRIADRRTEEPGQVSCKLCLTVENATIAYSTRKPADIDKEFMIRFLGIKRRYLSIGCDRL